MKIFLCVRCLTIISYEYAINFWEFFKKIVLQKVGMMTLSISAISHFFLIIVQPGSSDRAWGNSSFKNPRKLSIITGYEKSIVKMYPPH